MIVQLVTDRRQLTSAGDFPAQRQCLLRQAEEAVRAGVDMIQVREPDLDARDLLSLVRDVVTATQGSATRVFVNDRLDVALAAGAHGVHLPSRGFSPADVRPLAPPPFLIGVSVHAGSDVSRAAGADYLLAGTVWPSRSKPEGHRTIGIEGFRTLTSAAPVPVLSIGGVTVARAPEVATAGGAGVAAIGLFIDAVQRDCRAVSLEQTVRQLRQSFDTGRSHS